MDDNECHDQKKKGFTGLVGLTINFVLITLSYKMKSGKIKSEKINFFEN